MNLKVEGQAKSRMGERGRYKLKLKLTVEVGERGGFMGSWLRCSCAGQDMSASFDGLVHHKCMTGNTENYKMRRDSRTGTIALHKISFVHVTDTDK